MQAAEPGEFGLFQPGDHAEHPHLIGVLHLGLEADHVPQAAQRIVLPQLHHRPGPPAGARIGQADGFHRAEPWRVAAALDHHFNGHAAIEIGGVGLPFLEIGLGGFDHRIDEGVVLLLVHRAVEIILGVAMLVWPVPARLRPGNIHVDRITVDDRRDGIEERQLVLPGQLLDGLGERGGGERPGGDNDIVPFRRRQSGDHFAAHLDQRFGLDGGGDAAGEIIPVDRQRRSGRHARGIGGGHDKAAQRAHFLMDEADGVVVGVVGPKTVRTDQLGELVAVVRISAMHAAHFVQDDRHAGPRTGPGGFRTGKAAADDVDGFVHDAAMPAVADFAQGACAAFP